MRNPKNFVAVLPERASVVVTGARSKPPHAQQCPAIVETLEGRQLMSAGAVDPTFGNGGTAQLSPKTKFSAATVCDLPNNNFLVVGTFNATNGLIDGVFVARYNAKGKLDEQFGKNGKATFKVGDFLVYSAVHEPSGRIVLLLNPPGGTDAALLTGSPNLLLGLTWRGNLDAKFGYHGRLRLNDSVDHYDMASTPSGKILLAGVPRISDDSVQPTGFADGNGTVIDQLMPGGRPDPSFGNHGSIVTALDISLNRPTFLAAQHDGKIIVGVATRVPGPTSFDIQGVSIARYTQQGQPDTTFGTNGIISNTAVSGSIALTADDQIVAAYEADPPQTTPTMIALPPTSTVFRYTPAGQVDTTFNENGYVGVAGTVVPIPLADGKILIAASDSEGIMFAGSSQPVNYYQLDQSGAVDTTFQTFSGRSGAMAVEQHRAVVVSSSNVPAYSFSSSKHVVTLTAFQI